MGETVIKVENLSKAYQIGQIGTGTISRDLDRFVKMRLMGREDPFLKIGETNDRSIKGGSDIVWSLKDINFEIGQGDAVGIIGKNGAGKSTLLKLLSRVTGPTTGEIKVKGRIASLLEVGTGFHPELSGRENIYLNGAILGMRKKEITRKLDEIIDFSGVERYVDTPVKRYSSGMYVRLAFAVAAHLESEILIVDEVLAVGDAEFQKKCLGKMGDISKGEGRTVLFVSHNMSAVKNLCSKGILLHNGIIQYNGDVNKIITQYQKGSDMAIQYVSAPKNKDFYLERAKINSEFNSFNSEEQISFSFEIAASTAVGRNKFLLVRIMDELEQVLFTSEIELVDNKKSYQLTIPKRTLVKGYYKLNCIIYHPAVVQYDNVTDCLGFYVIDNIKEFSHLETFDIGRLYIPLSWQ
jgi:lipopolysaccharide transport system ATP-binding protein